MSTPPTGANGPPGGIPFVLPKFDGTLGALFVGFTVSTVLWGGILVQAFAWITSSRYASDGVWLKALVYSLCILDATHQIINTMGLYRYFVTGFGNPLSLLNCGPFSGCMLLNSEAVVGILMVFGGQIFFSRRLFMLVPPSQRLLKSFLIVTTLTLAFVSFGANIALVSTTMETAGDTSTANGLNQSKAHINHITWQVGLSCSMVCDVVIACAMASVLFRARTGMKKTNGILNFLITFTVSTGLLTTVCTAAALVTYIRTPSQLIYAGLELAIPKLYVNSVLAGLNSREFLREKLYNCKVAGTELSEIKFTPGGNSRKSGNTTVVVPAIDTVGVVSTFHMSNAMDDIKSSPDFSPEVY